MAAVLSFPAPPAAAVQWAPDVEPARFDHEPTIMAPWFMPTRPQPRLDPFGRNPSMTAPPANGAPPAPPLGNGLLKIRISGHPADVAELAERLRVVIDVMELSDPYPMRNDNGSIRRYATCLVRR